MTKYTFIQDSLHELSYVFDIMVGTVNIGETVSNNMQSRYVTVYYEVLFKIRSGFTKKLREEFQSVRLVQSGFCLMYVLLTYLITYLLAPCIRVHFEKLTSFQLVKKFPEFYGPRRFITTFTSARHLFLS